MSVPEWHDLDRDEPEDKLPERHNPPYMRPSLFTSGITPRIKPNAELDRQMDAWVKQFFRLPVLMQQVKPKIASLTIGEGARIIGNGYPEEGE